tara:strand:+ start:2197 stop:2358 length:162 start_codon:yes stop_codon:yes gene_type:complete
MIDPGVPANALPIHIVLYQNSTELEDILDCSVVAKAYFSLLNRFRVPVENSFG